MKLTWFGGRALRVHIGGEIVVVDPEGAPAGIDRAELLAGADRVLALEGDTVCPRIDPAGWRPRPVPRALDNAAPAPVEVFSIGRAVLLVDAVGEPPLVLMGIGDPPRFGRWASDAVIVLIGTSEPLVDLATVVLDVAAPRLIAIAADEQTMDLALEAIAEHLDGTGLVSLEPGMAVEV